MRARALPLVIVEQTLQKHADSCLNAVPVEVLTRAIPQRASLPRFEASLELQSLLQRMPQIGGASGHVSRMGS
jgi:hypothetical protein